MISSLLPQVFWAFLEGLGLIVSPCILPVLPLVLSSSIDGGRRRPYGIITGFVLAFAVFVLGARAVVTALHIDLDLIKNASLVLLGFFGIVLISEKLSAVFSRATQGAAELGSRVGNSAEGGYLSGLGIGALIGLVWTPCAGPLMAAVLVQVIQEKTCAESVFVTLAFALGAGIPMLVITLLGRRFIAKLGFFTKHAEAVRRTFGLIILAAVVFMAFGSLGIFAGQGTEPGFPSASGPVPADALDPVVSDGAAPLGLKDGLKDPYPAPEFVGIDTWLNTDPLTMAALKGKVVLVDFWTYSCINCVRTLPYLIAWDKKYRDKGLVIVGVHSPEFEFEKKVDNIRTALTQYGITYPVAVDSTLTTWVNFKNKYWPAHYLIDKQGRVVFTHFGEGRYDVTENNIRYLLGLPAEENAAPAVTSMPVTFGQTQETYLGSDRARFYTGKPSLPKASTATFQLPYFVPQNNWSLSGSWKIEGQKIISQQAGAKLQFNFNARHVFLVMGTSGSAKATLSLKLNGDDPKDLAGKNAPGGKVVVTGHALYEIIDQKSVSNSLLEITVDQPGVEFYAFTFGA